MKNRIIKILCLIIITFSFSLNIFGCTNNKENKITEIRYSEKEISIPEINNVYDLKFINNILVLLGCDSRNVFVQKYLSDDNWNDKSINIHYQGKITDDDSCLKALYEDKSIEEYTPIDGALSDDNNLAYIDYNNNQKDVKNFQDYTINHNIFTNDKKTIHLNIDSQVLNNVYNISYLNSKDLFAMTNEKIYQYNGEDGNLRFEYNFQKNNVLSQCCIENKLYVATSDIVEVYDITTGKKVEDIESLKDYIDPYTSIFKGIGSNMLIRNSDGLFSYKTNDGQIKKIIDGTETLIGDTGLNVEKIIEYNGPNSEYEYMVLYKDTNNKYKLYKYTYSKELSNTELTQIKVYSLYENYNVKNLVRKYQRNNPNLKINYEFGLSSNYGITVDDALKKLNTEIMAGKGPDILFLDGMSNEYYEKKGILENLNDIVQENRENLYSNIIDSFYNKNNIYRIPLNIKIPIIMGNNSVIAETDDLKSLSYSIEKNLKNQDINIFKIYNSEDIINLMYYSSCDNFIDCNNLNKENLKDFLENAKRIYDISREKVNNEEYKLYNQERKKFKEKYGNEYAFSRNNYLCKDIGVNNFVRNDITNLDVGYVSNLEQLSKITSVIKKRNDISYKYYSDNSSYVFFPENIISVNSKSKNIEISKQMVSDLLSDKYFDINKDSSFSINKNIVETIFNANKQNDKLGSFGVGNENGEVECKIEWLDDENYNYLMDIIESLDISCNTDINILDIVIKYGTEYIDDKISINDAVENISKECDIRLSE